MVLDGQHSVDSYTEAFPSWVGPGLILRQTGTLATFRLPSHTP
ncbi:hypothetical protein ACTMS2_25015 [Micromonospora sp. SD12]